MKTAFSKFLAIILCAALLFSFAPTALAQESGAEEPAMAEPVPTETSEPTPEPTAEPTPEPSAEPTPEPTVEPTAEPTVEPTAEPTVEPTVEPSPSPSPSASPSPSPSASPSPSPSALASLEQIIETAKTDGAAAAAMLNAYTDETAFSEGVKAVLELYYSDAQTYAAQLSAFTAAINGAQSALSSFAAAQAERNDASLPYKAGEILVLYDASVSASAAYSISEALDGETAEIIAVADTAIGVVEIAPDQTVEQAAAEYSAMDGVISAVPNYKNYAYEYEEAAQEEEYASDTAVMPTDPLISSQWYFTKIAAQKAWDTASAVSGTRARVAVLDTGAYFAHEDLSGVLNTSLSVDATQNPVGPISQTDPGEHGTHVCGIVAAQANNAKGIAGVGSGPANSFIDLVAVNVFTEYQPSKFTAYDSDVIRGVEYAVAHDCDVISLSLGRLGGYSEPYENAMNAAVAAGTIVVAAAGNEGTADASYPSDFPACVSVIATTNYTNAAREMGADFSNYGEAKDISAPGVSIYSSVNTGGYEPWNGTSMATPIVSAVCGMLRYVNPSISVAAMKEILYTTATDLYTPGFDIYTAWGNVNADAAVAVASIPNTSPVNVTAKARAYSAGGGTTVSWSALRGAKSYDIYRKTGSGGYSKIKTTSSLSYTDTACAYGTQYSYYVAGYTTAGGSTLRSRNSAAASAITAPKAPTSLKGGSTGTDEITIKWNASKYASGYNVYRSENNKNWKLIKTVSATRLTDTGLQLGKRYYYKVSAFIQNGASKIEGPFSSVIYRFPAPTTAENLSVKGVSLSEAGAGVMSLKWSAVEDADGYYVYRMNGDGSQTYLGLTASASYKDSKLALGKVYSYRVRAYTKLNGKRIKGNYSETASGKTAPGVPSSIRVITGAGKAKVSWSAVPRAAGYIVYRSLNGSKWTQAANIASGSTVSWKDSGLVSGRTYYYMVRAYSAYDSAKAYGAYSDVASGKA